MTAVHAIVFAALAVAIGAIAFFVLRKPKEIQTAKPAPPGPAVKLRETGEHLVDDSPAGKNEAEELANNKLQSVSDAIAETPTQPPEQVFIPTNTEVLDSASVPAEVLETENAPLPSVAVPSPQSQEDCDTASTIREIAGAMIAVAEMPAEVTIEPPSQPAKTKSLAEEAKAAIPIVEQTEPAKANDSVVITAPPQKNQEPLETPIGEAPRPVIVEASASAESKSLVDAISFDSEVKAGETDRPQRYRPPTQTAPRPPKNRKPVQPSSSDKTSELLLEIRVRMTFDRFGFCCLGLLPERKPDLDEQIIVKVQGEAIALVAQEEWYQDLQLADVGNLLQNAVELKGKLASGRTVRWLLTGRPIFVLASHQKASGFVQTTRIALGRTHVVLVTKAMQAQVEEILKQAGCDAYEHLQEPEGIPAGWVAFKNVIPTKSLALDAGADPFYPIKPAPDVEIDFVSGICLQNTVWLAGYPPKIKLVGQSDTPIKVLIDGKEAQTTAEGFLTTEGYDHLGQHSVNCEGLSCSRTYVIEEPSEDWSAWPAHAPGKSEICGPLLVKSKADGARPVTVPMSTPLLLGSEPGQVFRCSQRNVSNWKGYVPFEIVWALPAHPLRSDKRTARILQFKNAPLLAGKNNRNKATLEWCKAILDASRKGLRVENAQGELALWHQYKKEARKIWRAAK
jgi:hypothetical protein